MGAHLISSTTVQSSLTKLSKSLEFTAMTVTWALTKRSTLNDIVIPNECLSPRKTPLTPPILWKHPSFSPENQAQIYRKAVRRLARRIHLLVDYLQQLNSSGFSWRKAPFTQHQELHAKHRIIKYRMDSLFRRFYRKFPTKETCGMPLRRIRFLCADARVPTPALTARMTQGGHRSVYAPSPRSTRREHGATVNFDLAYAASQW